MPISIDLRRKIEEATRLIDAGKESYGSLAKRFGVGKATIYRIHFARLTAEVEGRKRELVELKRRTKELRVDFEGLENKYREKRAGLEEDYRKRRMELEERIEKLRQEAEAVKASLEGQGLSWDEGVRTLKEVASLKAERESLKGEIVKLKAESSNWKAKAKQAQSRSQQLKTRLSNLRGTIKKEEGWLNILSYRISSAQDKLYAIEEKKRDLMESVKGYEDVIIVHGMEERKASLQAEVDGLTEKLERLAGELEQLKVNKEGLTEELKRLEAERGKLREDEQEKSREIEKMQKELKQIVNRRDEEEEGMRRAAREREKVERDLSLLRLTLISKREELKKTEKKLNELEEAVKRRKRELRESTLPHIRLPKLPPLPKEET